MTREEIIILKQIAASLDKIANRLDKNDLEYRIGELESKVSAFPQVMEFIEGYNCCGYHD